MDTILIFRRGDYLKSIDNCEGLLQSCLLGEPCIAMAPCLSSHNNDVIDAKHTQYLSEKPMLVCWWMPLSSPLPNVDLPVSVHQQRRTQSYDRITINQACIGL